MSDWATINLGRGSSASGFPVVTAQIWQQHSATPIQCVASLPANSELEATLQHWQQYYVALHSGAGWRRSRTRSSREISSRESDDFKSDDFKSDDFKSDFEIDDRDLTVVSRSQFAALGETLSLQFNDWLNHPAFRKVDQMLRTHLQPQNEIRLIVTAEEDSALRLPWHLWQFLEDYPLAELALSPASYGRSPIARSNDERPNDERSLQRPAKASRHKVRILAILGDAQGIDIEADRRFLAQLPQSEITFLVEPDRLTLNQQLWQNHWDILFFAGHSSSQGQGQMQINASDFLTIEQLQYGLRAAIANGLKLAIFNSCDGLGLARGLADLHLPQVIVMREPVPDFVAQAFLKSFLAAFSGGRSLYASVRQAREQLQGWEDRFPCATWLPVVCQNPAELPPLWTDWCGPAVKLPRPSRKDGQTILLRGLLAAGVVAGLRWLGVLQPLELAAFDRLMQLRPPELPDPRLLIVRITEADLQAEGQALRQGSLSDRTLSQLLQKIEQAEPRVIGLDLYRDFSASPELLPFLLSDRLVAICKRPDATADPTGVLPPPEVDESRLGFSDFVQDKDGAVRRHLLFMSPDPASTCTAAYALSTQLAFRYLYPLGITPQFTPAGDLQLGSVTFPLIHARTGGYQPTDARGGQILLNYRAAPRPADVAQQVTVAQVLAGQVNAAAIKDRIVLIGVDALSEGDRWITLYGSGFEGQLPGVTMHAQMTSQILSTVLDRRPQLWVWSGWIEQLWIAVWAILASGLMWLFRRSVYRMGAIALCLLFLFGFCWALLLHGGWIPLVPAIGAVLLSVGLSCYRSPFKKSAN